MTTFVVPLDGSVVADHALRFACAFAARTEQSRVVLLTCTRSDDVASLDHLRDRAALFAGVVDIEVLSVDDEPVSGICAALASAADSVLCLATRSRRGLRSALFGSIAERLIREVGEPVLLVGPECRVAVLPAEVGRLVIATDGSDHASAALAPAARWASAFRLDSWLVDVIGPDERVAVHDEDLADVQDQEAESRLRSGAADLSKLGSTAQTRVLHGAEAARSIVAFAEQLPAALVAMATHGRSGVSRVTFGSTAMDVVRHAPCPVLVVRPSVSGAVE